MSSKTDRLMRLEIVRFLTHFLNRCRTASHVCLTCAKTYVKINMSKPLAFYE